MQRPSRSISRPSAARSVRLTLHQTDIIYYGFDLADYLRHEFELPDREPWPERVRPTRFWAVDRLQEERWADGPCTLDNRAGILPETTDGDV